MSAHSPDGWLKAADAVARFGINYHALREMVRTGVFTRGTFGTGSVRPPIYVRVDELQAWKGGGVEAVKKIKAGRGKQEPTRAKRGR